MEAHEWTAGTFGVRHFGGAILGHRRRSTRLVRLADQLVAHPTGTLPTKIPDPYQLDAAYRLFAHPAVTHTAVTEPHRTLTHRRAAEHPGVVLVAHDDTELHFGGRTRAGELGRLSGPGQRGFAVHSSLAVTPGGHILGLMHQLLLCPRGRPAKDTKSASRDAPDKVSRLWRDALPGLPDPPAGGCWVHLADRGADVTEFLDALAERGWHDVIRARHDRNATRPGEPGDGVKLLTEARTWPSRGQRSQAVAGSAGVAGRTATMCVSWGNLVIVPPRQARGRERGGPLGVGVVRVWEPNPPAGSVGLEWVLLTDLAVTDVNAAWERADWYARRWLIEEYHKSLKSGVGVEELQLTTRGGLEAAIGVLGVVAVALVTLRELARDARRSAEPAGTWVPPVWVGVLSRWRYREERPLTVGEFVRALARLGGHQNRPSDGHPGWQTLWRGWIRLMDLVRGWTLAQPERSGGT